MPNLDNFRRQESDWLDEHLPLMAVGIGRLTGVTLMEHGESATSVQIILGAYLGGAVLRASMDDDPGLRGLYTANHASWQIAERGMRYTGTLHTDEQLADSFGSEAAAAFTQISSPITRTVSSMIVGVSLAPAPLG